MTTLSMNPTGEIWLTLRGESEDRILTTLRRWPHWRRVDVERDPYNPARCIAVTLITDQEHESTVREILKRSFGMTFPVEGGTSEIMLEAPRPKRRGR